MKKFKIFKGWHYCINFIPTIYYKKKCVSSVEEAFEMHENFTLTKSCEYLISEKSCVNKLFGHCYGLLGVHKESDRFGWSFNQDTGLFDIFIYTYNKGKLFKDIITSVKPEEEFSASIYTEYRYDKRLVTFTVNNAVVNISFPCTNLSRWIFTLGPYFGGNSRAPQTMTIIKN